MKKAIEFYAELYSLRQDREGQVRVTFAVPRTHLSHMAELGQMIERRLVVTVVPDITFTEAKGRFTEE